MKFLFRFGKELFWTIVWVLVALIVAVFVLNWLQGKNIPFLSTGAGYVENHAGLSAG